jgi:hypothetical protein
MPSDSAQLAERIDRSAADVYAYVGNPANLMEWAPGLGDKVEQVGDDWFVESPMGRAKVTFAPANDFGVLDHEVELPTGQIFLNPVRVVAYGEGSEIVFTVRRMPGVSDDDFTADHGRVAADLGRLKRILENGQ